MAKKAIGVLFTKQQLCKRITFLCTFQVPLYGVGEHNTKSLFFSLLTQIQSFWIQPREFRQNMKN